ncbi:MAG: hypothetical protein GEV09_15870 [Pseudonocardiaceae bacterium]|nr:hypothetical protein [Pseudonocardiaceae bacterium]
MSHYHVTMTADGRAIPGDHAGVAFWTHQQAVVAAQQSIGNLTAMLPKGGNTDVTVREDCDRWTVRFTDRDGQRHDRTVEATECSQDHQLVPASAGSSDT